MAPSSDRGGAEGAAAHASESGMHERVMRWATMCRAVRTFFSAQGFIEVDTPVLIAAPAQEEHIEPVAVAVKRPDGQQLALNLQPSPELMMKRLVAAGLEKIFQLACVFRDGDSSAQHAPEFRLLEWYRHQAPYTQLMDDCEALIAAVAEALANELGGARSVAQWPRPYPRIRIEEAFERYAGFSPLDEGALAKELGRAGLHFDADDTPAELFGRVFAGVVEPRLLGEMGGQPFFLTHYPAYEAALAQLCPDDPRTAERFELYGGGLELANAFGELSNAREQRARFEATRMARAGRGQRTFPLDEAYLAALERLGAASGIALGLERLLMALLGEHDLASVRPWYV